MPCATRADTRHRGTPLPCAPIRPTAKCQADGERSGRHGGEARSGWARPASSGRPVRPHAAAPVCCVPSAWHTAKAAFAVCHRHVHTANFFQYFISNFQTFSFQFFSFSLVFYLMFKTLSHFLITSLKVTGQFMFYLDIAIISCVANKYLISKKIINIPLIRKLTKIWH